MKKLLSKKLQLRSTTIALLTGRGLGLVKGGTDDIAVPITSGLPQCEPAGNWSRNDTVTKPVDCHVAEP